ncbi:MAG TPA: hypothetical protein VG962_05230 [Steroidobacteraceae bacterium]|nr:hypothetical protein [Steroidobacteraceae bacterium]
MVLAFFALVKKFSTEEQFVREQSGNAYADYCRRTRAIMWCFDRTH